MGPVGLPTHWLGGGFRWGVGGWLHGSVNLKPFYYWAAGRSLVEGGLTQVYEKALGGLHL
jgi:hypothetical protein